MDPNVSPAEPPPRRPNAGLRREGRAAAIQFLFQMDLQNRNAPAEPQEQVGVLLPDHDFWKLHGAGVDPDAINPMPVRAPIAPKAKAFAEALVQGVWLHRDEVDAIIARVASNYKLSRLAAVDRNILRLAVYEILHNSEVPPVVAINEAIELAKQFGSEESGRFVNGVLDRVRAEVPRPARKATKGRGGPAANHP